MQVIGAGFGRTGTESTQLALEILLGAKCYHMKEVIERPDHLDRWHAFARDGNRGMDWQKLMQGYEACVDWPACNYYKDLMAAFPDAKVLLNVREPDAWFASFMVLVRINVVLKRVGLMVPKFRKFAYFIDHSVWHIFKDRRDKAEVTSVYARHVAEVTAQVPADKLLVFSVTEGWEPLCEFLGRPVPDRAFPRVNQRGDTQKYSRRRIAIALAKSLAVGGVVIAAIVLAGWLLGWIG